MEYLNKLFNESNNMPEDEEEEEKLCPICGIRPIHSITKTVKLGTFNGTYFKVTGEEERTTEWWTCKPCSKIKTPLFIEHMIKHFN